MIPKYINDWLRIIETMKNDNTYKLAWGRALVECVYYGKYNVQNNKAIVKLSDIAKCMLKYYWNQTFFFALKQSPYEDKSPVIVQITNQIIARFVELNGSLIPVWFDKAEEKLGKELDGAVQKVADRLHENVAWRFKRVDDELLEIYEYDYIGRSEKVVFNKEDAELLKEYALVVSKLLNYKWAQLLEKYNYAPKIVNKVNSISETKLRRESLTKYKNELMKQFGDGVAIDFYSGKPLANSDISVDHVIPWSFMYSDDIWNLVLTSKSNNSSKSNSIPSQEVIEKLKQRNARLVGLLATKFDNEIKESIEKDLVDKFYFECRM